MQLKSMSTLSRTNEWASWELIVNELEHWAIKLIWNERVKFELKLNSNGGYEHPWIKMKKKKSIPITQTWPAFTHEMELMELNLNKVGSYCVNFQVEILW